MTDSKKEIFIHLMSSLVRWTMNKVMKAVKKMGPTQRESVAHFVSGRAFLPARNDRTVRQQHHRPRSGVSPPSGFLFSIEEENE